MAEEPSLSTWQCVGSRRSTRKCIGCPRRSPTISFCCTASPVCRLISSRRWRRIRARARNCPELRLRVEERNGLTYPAWVSGDVEPDQFVVHDLADSSWAGCLAAVAGLAETSWTLAG